MSIPEILRDTGLPLVPCLPRIRSTLAERGAVVIRADPGSGKSSLVPLALLADTPEPGRILMLEPRRVAALSIAARMADLLGEVPGGRIGYAVKMERKSSPRTRIEVLTEGLLVRRLQADPDLAGVGTLIFDEFHERSLQADLALAFVLELHRLRSDLKLVIMSATMEAAAVADFIAAPVVDCPGRVFPVAIDYRPLPERDRLGRECGAAVAALAAERHGSGVVAGDTLVFLPGKREIQDAEQELRSRPASASVQVLTLHGGLSLAEQRRVIAPSGGGDGKRRIILATNVAETGLTVPGVDLVVDSGYVRLERFHLPTGMNRLSLEAAALSAADQRAGRAGRLGPGRCVRLWRPDQARSSQTEPEMLRLDLSALVLECALWGARRPEDLSWLTPPPRAAWDLAVELLIRLGALDATTAPTDQGRRMATLGLEPRLGALVLAGSGSPLACAAAAILADRDGSNIRDDADFRRRLAALRRDPDESGGQEDWIRRTRDVQADLLRRLGAAGGPDGGRYTAAEEADAGSLLAAAFPDRVAGRQEPGRFRFASGREARVEGPLATEEWLAAVEVDAGDRLGRIRLAVPLDAETARNALAPVTTEERWVEWKGLVPRTVSTRTAGKLVLARTSVKTRREEAAAALPALLGEAGLDVLPWTEQKDAPRRLLDRIRFLTDHGVDALLKERWTDDALIRESPLWLGPYLWNGAPAGDAPVLTGESLSSALAERYGWTEMKELARLVPEHYTLSGGRPKQLDYSSGEPVLRAKIQELFGCAENPAVLGVPVVFHLLSPAGRPLQITRDLAGFWTGSYQEIRKEMRGRYPRHRW